MKYIGLANTQTTYSNIRKYRLVLESIPSCNKVNISYNIVLPKPIIDVVMYQVEKIKMTYKSC